LFRTRQSTPIFRGDNKKLAYEVVDVLRDKLRQFSDAAHVLIEHCKDVEPVSSIVWGPVPSAFRRVRSDRTRIGLGSVCAGGEFVARRRGLG